MPIRRLLPAIWLAMGLVAPGVVGAHAELTTAVPEPGATLDEPPGHVEITFDDELDPERSRLSVSDPTGARVGEGGVDLEVADRNVLRATVEASAAGRYEVAWTAVAVDGHAESGTFAFTVSPVGSATPDTAMATRPTTSLIGVALVLGALIVSARPLRALRR